MEEVAGLELIRLSTYCPMLSPIEIIWSKLKANVNRSNRVPVVLAPRVMERRLVYLEEIIENAVVDISINYGAIQFFATFGSSFVC